MGKWTKIFIATCLTLVVFASLLVWKSPFSYDDKFGHRLVKHSVVIGVAAPAIYNYLGNSSNAAHWSEFVDHIVPLNSSSFQDGSMGSFRRCFKNADETGLQWDEEIVVAETSRRRRLTIFNMKNFPMMAQGLATEQIYEPVAGGTRLTFTLFFYEPVSLFDHCKMYLGAYRVRSIYEVNMNNIKRIMENTLPQK